MASWRCSSPSQSLRAPWKLALASRAEITKGQFFLLESHALGRAFGAMLKPPIWGCPHPMLERLGSSPSSTPDSSFLLIHTLERRQQVIAQGLGHLPPTGRPRLSFRLLALAWLFLGCLQVFREQTSRWEMYFSLSLFLSLPSPSLPLK